MKGPYPDIDSFIIRFIQSDSSETSTRVRGSIRHLQTSEERAFRSWKDVEAFIQRFIPVEWLQTPEPDLPEE